MIGRSPTERIVETPAELLDDRYRVVVSVDQTPDSVTSTITRFDLETGKLVDVAWDFISAPGIAVARHPSDRASLGDWS